MVWLFVTKKVMAASDNANSGATDTKDDDNEEISRTSTTTAEMEHDTSRPDEDDDIPIGSNSEVDIPSVDAGGDSVDEQSIQAGDISHENQIQTNDVENDNQSINNNIDGDTVQTTATTETVIPHNKKESEVILLDMDGTIIDNGDTDNDYDMQQEVVENEEHTLNGDGSTTIRDNDDTVKSTSDDKVEDLTEKTTDNTSTDEPTSTTNKEQEKKLIILPSFGDDPIIDYPIPQQVVNTKSEEEGEEEKETVSDSQGSVDEQVSRNSTVSDEGGQTADSIESIDESQANAIDNDGSDSNTAAESTDSNEDNSTATATTEEEAVLEEDDGPRQIKQVDYASKAAGAIILENSPSLEGASILLTSDKDKYSIAPCADKKYVVISLSEDILVKQIKLSNYERYSSRVKEFQVLSSQEYPSTSTTTASTETTTTTTSNNNEGTTTATNTIENNKDVWSPIGTYTVHSKKW